MSFLIHQFSRWLLWPVLWRSPLSLLGYIFGTIHWVPVRQEKKTVIDEHIESGRNVSARNGTQDPSVTMLKEGEIEYGIIKSKGETISGGVSGLVERLPSGDVVKSPWPGSRAADCRRDITTEFQIYEKLGSHPRLVKIISWDPKNCVLTMEYMPNGCLKDYLCTYHDKIPIAQRLQWVREIAEGLQLLHSANIIHCDVEPKNLLLDVDLSLKIADFSGSSFEGSQGSACVGTRFLQPDFNWRSLPTIQQDLFSFGSTIYNIMTGKAPFQELESNKVEELYKANEFPDVMGILCGEIIEQCWHSKIASAHEIYNSIQTIEMELLCEINIYCTSINTNER